MSKDIDTMLTQLKQSEPSMLEQSLTPEEFQRIHQLILKKLVTAQQDNKKVNDSTTEQENCTHTPTSTVTQLPVDQQLLPLQLEQENTTKEEEKERQSCSRKIVPFSLSKNKKKKRRLLLLLIATLLLGTTISAALHLDQKFLHFFRLTFATPELEKTAIALNQSCTTNGLTVTAKQLVGDKNGFYVVLSVKTPTEDLIANGFKNISITMEDHTPIAYTSLSPVGEDNGTASYILFVGSTETVQDKSCTITLTDYGFQDECLTSVDFETIQEGTWTFSCDLTYPDVSQSIQVNQPVQLYQQNATLDTISITPFSLSLNLTKKSDMNAVKTDPVSTNAIKVELMDGTLYNSEHLDTASLVETETGYSLYFNKIIDYQDIVNVSVGDLTIEINENPNPIKYETYTNSSLGFSLDLPKELFSLLTPKIYESFYDQDFKTNARKVDFIGSKNGVTSVLFSIEVLQGTFSKEEILHRNPMTKYVGINGTQTYVLNYAELDSEEAINTFSDIMNQESTNILSRISYLNSKVEF